MDIQSIINGRVGISLGYGLGKIVPPRLGNSLSGRIGEYLATRKDLPMVKAVHSNLWMATGEKLSSSELNGLVKSVFRQNAQNIYSFYRNFRDSRFLEAQVEFPPLVEDYYQRFLKQGQGLIAVGVHISNFDLALHALARQLVKRYGLRPMAIAAPEISKGYSWQNEFRRQSGLDIIPASMVAVREAAERLKAGEMVVSGLDRPIPDGKYRPRFFGRPAAVPVLHVPLALKTGAPLVVICTIRQPQGNFKFLVSEPIYLDNYPDRMEEMVLNAEKILAIAEDYIRQATDQWFMPYPIWPDVV